MIIRQLINIFVNDMNKYKKPEFNEEKLGKNPFLLNLVIPVRKEAVEGRWVKDEGILVPLELEMEIDEYCKIYIDSRRRKDINKLTARAKDLFVWILYTIETNKDHMWLNKRRYMDECNVKSINTYKEALNEMISGGMLSKTIVTDVMWINPDYFFKGSRVNLFPKNVKRK